MQPPLGKPCRECPFRRRAAAGWLGADTPEHFAVVAAGGETPMPCHLEVDYNTPAWRANAEAAHQCSGHAIFLGNLCKSPRSEEVRTLPANRELVFARQGEFVEHHGGDMVRYMQLAYPQLSLRDIKKLLKRS